MSLSNGDQKRAMIKFVLDSITDEELREKVIDAVDRSYWLGFDEGYAERNLTGHGLQYDR
jgi:hypothetical protein